MKMSPEDIEQMLYQVDQMPIHEKEAGYYVRLGLWAEEHLEIIEDSLFYSALPERAEPALASMPKEQG